MYIYVCVYMCERVYTMTHTYMYICGTYLILYCDIATNNCT